MNFYETRMGREFFEGRVPGLIKAINRLAEAVEKSNEIALGKNANAFDGDNSKTKE